MKYYILAICLLILACTPQEQIVVDQPVKQATEELDCYDENAEYTSTDPEACKILRFVCVGGMEYFSNECGCGCTISEDSMHVCTEEEKAAEACYELYLPVCGVKEDGSEETFSNDCYACKDGAESWTHGECSEPVDLCTQEPPPSGEIVCAAIVGYYFDGEECVAESGCTSEGVPFETKEDCQKECIQPTPCIADVHQCDDGTYVSRDPYNNCEFMECPKTHYCEDTLEALPCTKEYDPVCGFKNGTKEEYGNSCTACNADIDFWTEGQCS